MSRSPLRLSHNPAQNNGTTIPYRFTGNRDADIGVLAILDDRSLGSMCSTDRYIRSLCHDEELWKRRMKRLYPDVIRFKDGDETWREFYIIISRLTLDTEGANWAAVHGYLSALRYLASLEPPVYVDDEGLFEVMEHSNAEVLEWVSVNTDLKLTQDHIEVAIETGNYDTFEWIMENMVDPRLYHMDEFDLDDYYNRFDTDEKFIYYSSDELAKYAIKYGRLNMLISILQKYPYIIKNRGSVDVIRDYDYHDVSSLIEATVESGHTDIIEWGYDNLVNGNYETRGWNSRFFIKRVISNASSNGRLHILDWIVEFIESYKDRSDETSSASNVDDPGSLYWVLENIISGGIMKNRIEVVEWALSKDIKISIDIRRYIEISRRVGNIQMADYLQQLL